MKQNQVIPISISLSKKFIIYSPSPKPKKQVNGSPLPEQLEKHTLESY
jgi:hypothetical protein